MKKRNFFQIQINQESSKIFYFENNSLKNEEIFNFGSDILIRDIIKITSLKSETVQNILINDEFENISQNDEYIDKKFLLMKIIEE